MKTFTKLSAAFLAAFVMSAIAFAADEAPAAAASAEAKEAEPTELSQEQQDALMKMFNSPATDEEIAKALYFVPDVLVEYDGKKLTRAEIIDPLKEKGVPAYVLNSISDDELRDQIKKAAEGWVEKQVLLNAAKKAGFEPTAEFAKKKVSEELKELSKEKREALDEALKAKDMTIETYIEKVAADMELLENLVINSYLDKVIGEPAKKAVTDKDVENFYNENKAEFEMPALMTTAHILIMPDEDEEDAEKADKEAKAKIDAIAKDLKADPSKFGEIAEAKSDCPSGKASKGELPAFAEDGSMPEGGAMIPDFAAAAFKLEKDGQISDPIKTSYGYHIIKRISKSEATVEKLENVKDAIKDLLVQEKASAALEPHIEGLVKDAKAKYYDFKAKPAEPKEDAKDAKAEVKEDAKPAVKVD